MNAINSKGQLFGNLEHNNKLNFYDDYGHDIEYYKTIYFDDTDDGKIIENDKLSARKSLNNSNHLKLVLFI